METGTPKSGRTGTPSLFGKQIRFDPSREWPVFLGAPGPLSRV